MESNGSLEERRAGDDVLLEFLASGGSLEQCAAAAGISVRTIQRRLRDDEFRRELALRRAARVEQLTARLCAVTDDAVSVIIAAFQSASGHVRLRAADLTLTWRCGPVASSTSKRASPGWRRPAHQSTKGTSGVSHDD